MARAMVRSVVLLAERPRWRSTKSVREVGANNFYMRQRPETKGLSRRKVGFGQRAFASALAGLLRSYNSDSSHLALMNQINKANVRFVKSVMSHWGSGLSGFLTKLLIHRQPLFENRTPFAG